MRQATLRLRLPRVTRGGALAATAVVALVLAWALYLHLATLGGKASFIIVNGSSMEPALRDGDLTLVHRRSSYSVGEIAAFRAGGGIAIHRIQSIEPDGAYVMKGDNKERIDPWLPGNDNMLGEVVLRVPYAGRVLQNGGALIFGVLAGLLVTLAIYWQGSAKPPAAIVPDAAVREPPNDHIGKTRAA